MAVIGATQLEPVNVLGQYVQGLEAGRQSQALRRQETEALRAAQQEQALNALVQSGALATPEGRNQLMQTPGGLALLESYGKTQEQLGKGTKAQSDALTARVKYFRENIPSNPRAAASWLTNMYSDPLIGPELQKAAPLEKAVAAIPQDENDFLGWMEGMSNLADQYVERRVPTATSMLPYTQELAPGVEEQKIRIAGAGASRTTIQMPPAGKKFSETLGEKAALRLDDFRTKAESARRTLSLSERLRPLLNDPAFISGTLAQKRTAAARALGMDVAATEAFFAGIGDQVAERITQFGAGTGLSDADRQYAKQIVGGEETFSKEGIEKIMRINDETARDVIRNYGTERERLAKKEPEVLDYYPELSAEIALSAQDQDALNWANANPNDPRSTKIKQRLGVQ